MPTTSYGIAFPAGSDPARIRDDFEQQAQSVDAAFADLEERLLPVSLTRWTNNGGGIPSDSSTWHVLTFSLLENADPSPGGAPFTYTQTFRNQGASAVQANVDMLVNIEAEIRVEGAPNGVREMAILHADANEDFLGRYTSQRQNPPTSGQSKLSLSTTLKVDEGEFLAVEARQNSGAGLNHDYGRVTFTKLRRY